ncbi:MAG TPA: bifunctional precorrin-2 dehydrogenase/sirohydrochlorin ferrochelatase [Humisphaera sp.]|nr:bifunctional precorrin-2 dehydrogenase/sirohydrochlorin ferrochelatase [Humisphaera sp.]
MPHSYPLLLDVCDRPILIIGGGAVAARKAVGVIAAGANQVRCVSPTFQAELPASVERIVAEYNPKHLDGAKLVFAATDRSDVNAAVVRDCRARGIWVNRADSDEAEPGDFVTPAKLEEGPVIVAVSAGSAALSAAIRDQIAKAIDRRYIQMAEAMKTIRPLVLAKLDASKRAAVFRELAGEEAIEVLARGGMEGLREWIGARHPELL